ncbi:MAG: hypothetical protein EOO40_06985, partial [Deltaproteobacteria bacterium]
MSNTQMQGGFGGFRLAVRLSDGERLGAKVLRLSSHPDAKLNRKAWLKMRGQKKSPTGFSAWDQVRSELGLARKVKSPLLPEALVKDEGKHKLYMFSKLCEGDLIDLHSAYGKVGADPEHRFELTMSMLCQVGEALRAAHAEGIVHRDTKLENILWTAKGKLLLADFGLAMGLGADGKVSGFSGTAGYIGEEAFGDEGYDARFDMFGLGATVVAFLFGETPFGDAGDRSHQL